MLTSSMSAHLYTSVVGTRGGRVADQGCKNRLALGIAQRREAVSDGIECDVRLDHGGRIGSDRILGHLAQISACGVAPLGLYLVPRDHDHPAHQAVEAVEALMTAEGSEGGRLDGVIDGRGRSTPPPQHTRDPFGHFGPSVVPGQRRIVFEPKKSCYRRAAGSF